MLTTTRISEAPYLEPYSPEQVFPIKISVFETDSDIPDICHLSLRDGDLYLCPSQIWIVQGVRWLPWVPDQSILLDFDGQEFYTAPCAAQGLRLVKEEETHKLDLSATRRVLGLADTDDMTPKLIELIRASTKRRTEDAGSSLVQVCIVCTAQPL